MKYRSFTLRLTETETSALEELKELLNVRTDTSVIRRIINNYKSLHNDLIEARRDSSKLSTEHALLKERICVFLDAFKALETYKE
jgi:hypothetical protein